MAAHDPQFGPPGDPSRHLPLGELEQKLGTLPAAPRDAGRVALLVRRRPDKVRETPTRIDLGPDTGVPGDAWGRGQKPDRAAQVTVMEIDVAEMVANGQPLTVFGDNLFLALDLSVENLPTGSRLRLGRALLEVTAKPHNGCRKFAARFGHDALRLVANPQLRHRNLRGIYMSVVEAGEVAVGDAVAVVSRPD
ncbi:MAG: MOSC domain-containing protein [Deltaproteobacteria bacterium]|nr:MAG: MOSC domain-containing protein [Deltaproteobacteria bacterium]